MCNFEFEFEFIHPHLNKNINHENSIIHLHQPCYDWEDIQRFFNDFENLNTKLNRLEWVGYIHYEAGYELMKINRSNKQDQQKSPKIIAEFIGYEIKTIFKTIKSSSLLALNHSSSFLQPIKKLQQETYTQQVKKIQSYIYQGHTYQINHTFSLPYRLLGTLKGLFEKLYPEQKTIYGCFLKLQHQEIACFSPELLVEKQGNQLMCKPMKGTAAINNRSTESIENELHNTKNHAENVMIVDLLRHDLNRLNHSNHDVKVTELFAIEYHKTLAQMTSTIVATFDENKLTPKIIDVLKALFPCGSIIGAPKKRSMEIIDEIENRNRGVYTGAIGWGNLTDYQLTVPIRTFSKTIDTSQTIDSMIHYNTGSGITIDSDAQAEWQECLLKTQFLEKAMLDDDFGIIETMKGLWNIETQTIDIPLWELHFSRLKQSCLFIFGEHHFKQLNTLNENLLKKLILEEVKNDVQKNSVKKNEVYRIRLQIGLEQSLEKNCCIQVFEIENTPIETVRKVLINPEKYIINEKNWYQAHKTTIRTHYNNWYLEGEKLGFYDVIAVNSSGNIAESCRHIVMIWDENRQAWITPPHSDGALNSVYMASLIQQNIQVIYETISVEMLLQYSKTASVYLANAVRGQVLVSCDI